MNQIQSILGRSIWLYLAVAMVFAVSVDFKQAAKERSLYLLGICYNQNLQNTRDNMVYQDHLKRIERLNAQH